MKRVNHLQIAIMFNSPLNQNFSYFDLTAGFKREFKALFKSTDPFSPIPSNQPAPPEIPRYILQPEDGKYSFSFAGTRFDFHFNNEIETFNICDFKQHIFSISKVLKEFEVNSFRTGIVIDGTINDSTIMKTFINKDTLKDSEEIQLSFRNKISGNGYTYNKWIKYACPSDDGNTVFQIDINSIDFAEPSKLEAICKCMIDEIGEFIGS